MDYAKHYRALIDRARDRRPLVRCYFERHHIQPKCMGGGNEDSNLVRLLPEEHYVAHLLLAKIHADNGKLAYALLSMRRRGGQRSGPMNKRYAKAAERGWEAVKTNWRCGWAVKFKHRPRKKRRYGKAELDKMRTLLTPRQNFS